MSSSRTEMFLEAIRCLCGFVRTEWFSPSRPHPANFVRTGKPTTLGTYVDILILEDQYLIA